MDALRSLNIYLRPYRWRFLFGGMLMVISNLLIILPIPYIGRTINIIKEILSQFEKGFIPYALKKDIIRYGSIIITVPIIGGIIRYYMRQLIITTSRMIEFDMKNEIYAHYQKLSPAFYKRNSTGDLINRLTEDVSLVRQYLGPGIMYLINLFILTCFVILQMLRIDPILTFYVLLPIPLLFISIYYLSSTINKKSQEVQTHQSLISSFIQDTFSGIHILKSFVVETYFYKNYKESIRIYQNKNLQLTIFSTLLSSMMILLTGTSQLLILYIGGKRYFEGMVKDIGTLAEFFIYINILIWPFITLGWVVSTIQRAKVSQKRIDAFLKESPEISNQSGKHSKIQGKITFKNVSLVYANTGIQALKDLSFTIEKGKNLAIIGATGSGKSTIVQLIPRLYDPTEGEIFIDDRPLKELHLYDLRKSIGYVPQESFLFSDSIHNNIALGAMPTTLEKVIDAAKKARVEEDILSFKKGYETILGERGVTLSGGQKQRISIARVLIKNPQILIFDDSLSAIDQQTKQSIRHHLQNAAKDRTIITITHEVSYVKGADMIIVLEKGKIIEQGDHQSLITQKGYYLQWYYEQSERKKLVG
ncbi:MAG: ABC transporter ATP-binding protein [Flavobacteriales bacterium AspAUS03]